MAVSGQNKTLTYDGGMRALISEETALIRAAHFAGANGTEIVQRHTALIDRVLRDGYSSLDSAGQFPVLMAVGGYGRGEMNPHSDIDIMLLCRNEEERRRAPELLYRLWDAGLDVGYSVRTLPECIDLGRKDATIRTSLMESRLIAGDAARYHAFRETMLREVFFWRASSFITEKLSERQASRQKYGSSIYLREPNIKDGAGGLRDIHTAFWVSFVRFRAASLAELVPAGVITPGQYAVFLRSRNFLWRLRNEIHYLSGRKNDHLTFDLQERAATDFGYRDSQHLLGVERFMKVYFLHARNIREFSNTVMDAALHKTGTSLFSRTLALGRFSLAGKTIIPAANTVIQEDPALILDAFRIMQTRRAVFSQNLKLLVRQCRIDETVRTDPAATKTFLAILDTPEQLFEVLTLMKDLRFLGRYIPEFRAVQALAKHDYYHKYTVDEHTLMAVKNLQDLWMGRYPSLMVLTDALRSLRKRWVLMLAVLLHDLGKAYRSGHEHRGVELAERILNRLGIEEPERQRILFLVNHHLLMSNLSQRRELTDHRVIEEFARVAGDRENLTLLYLLTYADIAAVGPAAWTQWKAALLQELYQRTIAFLEKKQAGAEAAEDRFTAAVAKLRTAAERVFSSEDIEAFLAVMPGPYFRATSPQKILDHLGMMKRLAREQLVMQHRHYPERGYTELTVCAYDAYGMLSRIAGTLASKNLNILRAQVYTATNGVMIDTIQVTDAEGNISLYDDAWESVKHDLREALMTGRRPPAPGILAQEKPAAGAPPPSVEFDNAVSDAFTIIDVSGRDRVGLLYLITRTFYDLNLDIASAKIVTEGARVMDSFYVTDLLKKKILDPARIKTIRKALLAVLQ